MSYEIMHAVLLWKVMLERNEVQNGYFVNIFCDLKVIVIVVVVVVIIIIIIIIVIMIIDMSDGRFSPRFNRVLPSSGLLRGVRWFETEVFLENGIDRLFRNVGYKQAYVA